MDSEKLINIYFYSGLIGTIIFILKTALPIDTGSEVSTDFTSSIDSDASFHLFTIEGIAAFFMCSGWMGWLAFKQLNYELQMSLIISVGSGVLGMAFFSWLIQTFKKFEHVPKPDYKELLNKKGKAYIRFKSKGTGEIMIEFNSKLQTLDAINEMEEEIAPFSPIVVTKVEGDTIYVKKAL